MSLPRAWPGSPVREVPHWVELALTGSAVPSAVVGTTGRIRWSNRAFRTLLGLPDALTPGLDVPANRLSRRRFASSSGSSFFDLGPDAGGPTIREAIRAAATVAGHATTLRHQLMTIADRHLTVDLTITSLVDRRAEDRTGLALVQLVDRSTEDTNLSTSRALSENALDVVVLATGAGRVQWASPSVSAVLGLDPMDLVDRPLAHLLPAEDVPLLGELLAARASDSPPARAVLRIRSASGAFRSMSVSARPHSELQGEAIVALGMRDVTDELRAKRELARSEEQFRMAMLGAPEGMAVADAQDRIVQVNPALSELLGRPAPALIGHRFREFIPAEQRDHVDQWRGRLLKGPASIERLQHPMSTPTGEVWVDHSVGIMRDDAGSPALFVHQFADRTALRIIQADLAYRASHDSQTGLANRDSLLSRLSQRLGSPPASSYDVVGVLFADIDNLKPINDQLGHPVGDAVIEAVAARLQESVRRHDIVARVGGDEFAIVLERCSTIAELEVVARNVQVAASQPVVTAAGTVDVTITVGAVLAASSADTDLTLARVDEALYEAKRGGRNRVGVSHVLVEG